jgi:hypothetical protein
MPRAIAVIKGLSIIKKAKKGNKAGIKKKSEN